MICTKSISIFLLFITCICISVLLYFVPTEEYKTNKISGIQMAKVVIYTKSYCPYCVKAKGLLKKKDVAFEEIDIENDQALAIKVMELSSGRKTVPQIFIDDSHIGGCDDLYALDEAGKLDAMLK